MGTVTEEQPRTKFERRKFHLDCIHCGREQKDHSEDMSHRMAHYGECLTKKERQAKEKK